MANTQTHTFTNMTWNEFKALIDKHLQEHGKDGSLPIAYIDISCPILATNSNKRRYKVPDIYLHNDELSVDN